MVPKRAVLDNGLVLLTSEQRALPMVAIELIDRRRLTPRSGATKPELANLDGEALTYGTRNAAPCRSATRWISSAPSLSTGCWRECCQRQHDDSQKRSWRPAWNYWRRFSPRRRFRRRKLTGKSKSIIAGIRAREEDPGAIAGRAFAAALFPQSPYGRPVEGTEASVKTLQRAKLERFLSRAITGPIVRSWPWSAISLTGEIVQALNQALRAWTKGEPRASRLAPSKIGAPQTHPASTRI